MDSACDVPSDFIKQEEITILPVTVQIGNAVLADMRNEEATLNFLTGDTAAQAYNADTLSVNSRKTLEMVKAGDRWVIVRESVGG